MLRGRASLQSNPTVPSVGRRQSESPGKRATEELLTVRSSTEAAPRRAQAGSRRELRCLHERPHAPDGQRAERIANMLRVEIKTSC